MKMLNALFNFSKIILLSIIVLSLSQCKKAEKGFNPAFTEKISAFTSGTISCESVVRVVLAEDNVHAGEANSPADNDLFKFSPGIKGQVVWVDKRTLEFRPSEKLISGTKYEARFDLGSLVKVERKLKTFTFSFTVVKQDWTVSEEGYQTMNENDLVWNRIKGIVNTADVIDKENIIKYFTVKQDKQKLNLKWEQSDDRRSFIFSVDSVRRTENKGSVIISWDASGDFKDLKGQLEIEIPALGDYKVMDVKVIQQPEQYIEIMFSDPIKKNQNFQGLVFLENGTSLEYSVTGNILRAYPVSRVSGDTKITISEGLVNILGYPLKESFTGDLTFEVAKPAIRITGKGVILPSSKGMIFPFEAVNLSAVDVKIIKIFENNIGQFLQVNKLDGQYELKRAGRLVHKEKVVLSNTPVNLGKWNRFFIDLAKLVEPDQGAIYRVEISFKKAYSLYPCEGAEQEDQTATNEEEEDYGPEAELSYWDSYEENYDEYYDYEDYDYEERNDPCKQSYYSFGKTVARNILASDLGIIVKTGTDHNLFCAVTNLVSSSPISDVNITVLDYQQQVIGTGTTDKDGFVIIPFKEKPYLVIAKKDNQRGYLRVDDGSSLSLGAFDVSGKTIPKGLKAFLFGERGVWRPGDTLFLTCILEDKQKTLPPNHPVIFEISNPKGQLYARATRTTGVNGFYTWQVPTTADALTGNYNLTVKIGGTEFNKNLKIETIKPNRLKINLQFDTDKLSFSKPDVKGTLSVLWLHGAVAQNLKTTVSVTLTNASTTFAKYDAYQFTDPSRNFSSEEQTVFDGSIDAEGKATIPGHFSVEGEAPGLLNANFTTRVFEKSGDFSIDHFTMPYSPYEAYIGIKTPQGDKRGMLLTDTTHWVDVVLINDNGQPVSRTNLEAYVYKLDWRNWWESSDNDLADFIGNTYNSPIVSRNFSVVNGKGRFSFRVNHPEWGRFYVRVVDPESGHSAGKIIYLDWPGWAGRPLRENAEAASMLTFNTDKQKYKVGETAEVIIPAGGSGNALICIESGSRILSYQWLPVDSKEIRHKFTVTKDMTPNVYIHVSLVQPHASSQNDMPMRLYGVLPLFVEDDETKLEPVIKMPETMEPLNAYNIQVGEKRNHPMTYTLAIVEDGLLDLTRFKTPDPWNEFYAREALGVKTWDLYDMVIGAYGGKLESVLGIGGDEDKANPQAGEKANRFKPVVRFMGPFELKAGKTNNHKVALPNYIGSVRVMVVAGQEGAYGFAEKTVPVKKPLMVLGTLPRVLGPGETVKLPVTVFAMDKNIKDVSVNLKVNNLIIPIDDKTQTVHFDKPGEKIVVFTLQIAKATGIGKVQINATSGKNTSGYDLELDVRNANPSVTTFAAGTVAPAATAPVAYTLPGMPGTNKVTLEVSSIPPMDLNRRLKYLIQYPHGCVEQTTSSVFPQLYLSDLMTLDEATKSAIDGNIKAGIKRLLAFQQSGGGFSYWPGSTDFSAWASSYAGNFLLEAEKKGYSLPAGMKTAWLKSQKQLARQWKGDLPGNNYYQSDLEQAYRLYTLALAGEADMSAMNRLKEIKTISLQAKFRLAAAYALSGQTAIASELISRETTDIEPYRGFYSSYGSRERDWAMFLETMVILKDHTKAAGLMKKISEALSSSEWMSTQSTAYCLMAASRFATVGSTSTGVSFSYSSGGKQLNVQSDKPVSTVAYKISQSQQNGSVSFTNHGKGTIFVRVIMEGIPEAGNETAFESNLKLGVQYFTRDGDAIDVSKISQGTDFMAKVTIYNPTAYDYRNLALTQIFPPGWEISNNRLWNNELANTNENPTYQDIRDDRIYTYFDLAKGQSRVFIVQLNASYLGKYYLSGAYCEAMYDNSVSALTKGEWVEVTEPGN
ncbi:MAG TPA: MG2 domain-containing protein [Bacteroidales bacterium]|nr:MG2 domain-containing protein [Bacteroidales bacterium]